MQKSQKAETKKLTECAFIHVFKSEKHLLTHKTKFPSSFCIETIWPACKRSFFSIWNKNIFHETILWLMTTA